LFAQKYSIISLDILSIITISSIGIYIMMNWWIMIIIVYSLFFIVYAEHGSDVSPNFFRLQYIGKAMWLIISKLINNNKYNIRGLCHLTLKLKYNFYSRMLFLSLTASLFILLNMWSPGKHSESVVKPDFTGRTGIN